MDLATFRGLLALHGPDLARWPSDTAEDAVALMTASVEAQDLLAEASVARGHGEEVDPGPMIERIIGAIRER
jgi:hypothetical protein